MRSNKEVESAIKRARLDLNSWLPGDWGSVA
jgi:hypothetical protein